MTLAEKPFLTLSDLEKLPKLQRDALLKGSRHVWRWDAESNRLLNMRHSDNATKRPKQDYRWWQEPQPEREREALRRPAAGQNLHVYQRIEQGFRKPADWVLMRVLQWDSHTVWAEHPDTLDELELCRLTLKKHGFAIINVSRPGEAWFYTAERMQEMIKREAEAKTARDELAAARAYLASLEATAFTLKRREQAILPIPAGADKATIMRVFRERAKLHHPDAGGNSDDFRRLCEAKDKALAEVELR